MSDNLPQDRISRIASETDGVEVHYFVTAINSNSDPKVKRKAVQTFPLSCVIIFSLFPSSIPGGHISTADVAAAVGSLDSATMSCYLCGPPPMTESLIEILVANCKLSHSQIHCEKWW